jgi:TonB family protein
MSQAKKKKEFLPQPIYPGGPKAMGLFIQEQLQYPKEAKEQAIEGTVMVRIEINYQGQVIHAKSINHLGGGCEAEAERVASLLRFEIPKIHKLKVRYFKKINVRFRMPAAKEQNTLLQYKILPAQKETSEPTVNSYHYTIRIN